MKDKYIFRWETADILKASSGKLICGDISRSFSMISIDSRTIAPDELFIAIRGEVHDGHRFCQNVVEKGVCGLVIENDKAPDLPISQWKSKNIVCVVVPDTTIALGKLAAFHRKRSGVSLTAITGSNGKTSTRKMTTEVLSQKFKTHSTQGNFNNEIGLPLTLFQLKPFHEQAVVELGMNHAGEIRRLANISTPDIAVITNIGPAHLEGLGSLENIMRAKGEILERLAPEKTAVLNADDPYSTILASERPGNTILFGLSEKARIRASDIRESGISTAFTLLLPNGSEEVCLRVPGRFMVSNALAAAAVGWIKGLSVQEIKAGLEAFEPVHGRMNIIELQGDIRIIDDTYNANPASTQAALNTLKSLKDKGRRIIFVAGDMRELGEQSQSLHYKTGSVAAESGIEKLYITGEFAKDLADGALNRGMMPKDVFIGTQADILRALSEDVIPGDRILIKGSRAMAMEKIVKGLKEFLNSQPSNSR
jgi:UDP-N-acetylmuramoyl-tripeptide--D-alanyl-D-alanine ligase